VFEATALLDDLVPPACQRLLSLVDPDTLPLRPFGLINALRLTLVELTLAAVEVLLA
jgi:hypothetical protein